MPPSLLMSWRGLGVEMTFLQAHVKGVRTTGAAPDRPLRPWPALVPPDKAPPPKPLVMGGTLPPLAPSRHRVRTHWQPQASPVFPIEPANDPVQRLLDDDRASMTLLALILCVTVSVALLGFGLQVLQ
jgi:hypothetical protein